MNELDIVKTTSVMNTNLFLTLSVIEYVRSENKTKPKKHKRIARISAIILFIAGLHYAILEVNKPSIELELYIRYSDWILTTPLLLIILGEFYEINKSTINQWILLDIIMVSGGLLHEKTENIVYWYIGTSAYLILLGLLSIQLPNYKLFTPFFLFGWAGYGIVSRFERENRIVYYNILDFYNKFVFAIVVEKLLNDIY
jgi:bacteriorhodopsin